MIVTPDDVKMTWRNMLERCYSYKPMYHAYWDCEVCDEWKNDFESFKEWYYQNLWSCPERLELDKDLLSNGKKIYSQETCCLIPKSLNVFLSTKRDKTNYLPIGVTYSNGKY